MLAKDNSEESLINFIQGAEQMKTALPRYAVEGEEDFQPRKKLEGVGIEPTQGKMTVKLSKGKDE
jgi:hypothetical protein